MRTPENAASQFGPAYDKGQRTLNMATVGDSMLGWGEVRLHPWLEVRLWLQALFPGVSGGVCSYAYS